MIVAALVVVAVLLAWPVPRLLPRLRALRHVPGPALLLWQSVSLAAVIAGLSAAPVAALQVARQGDAIPAPTDHLWGLALACVVTGPMVVRLLFRAHRVGTSLRRARRDHRHLVDLLGMPPAPPREDARVGLGSSPDVRVLEHPTPTAYCVPGRHGRVVLTDSTMASLPPEELSAVLAHERAHLRYRHDLVLEYFTVLHSAVPAWLRSGDGLREVRLLIELLADRAALQRNDPRALGRALVTLSNGTHPGATLGAEGSALVRLQLLSEQRRRVWLTAATTVAAAGVLALPLVLVGLALF